MAVTDGVRRMGVLELLAARAEQQFQGEATPIEVTLPQFEELLTEQLGVTLRQEMFPRRVSTTSLSTRCRVAAGVAVLSERLVTGVVKKATEEGEVVREEMVTRPCAFMALTLPAERGVVNPTFVCRDVESSSFGDFWRWAGGQSTTSAAKAVA